MLMRKNIMVCVTQQKTCERLILKGNELIESEEDKLFVIHVVNEKEKFLDSYSDGEALEYLFQVSKKSGADLTVLRSKNILKTLVDFARDNEITHIIMGVSPVDKALSSGNIRLKLQNELPDVEFIVT
ncbi:MAG: universal stress protein [Tissierellia bacterium]|nr:universal stress protein [Tissierellia bacterium]